MPIHNILMPQLGESVTEGTIEKWFVQPGDKVNKYDPLAEVLTDKVTAEIPSSFTGTITELIAKEGETLPVGEVVCTIEVVDQSTTNEQHDRNSSTAISDANLSLEPAPKKNVIKIEQKQNSNQKTRYSPAVLRLANEHQIDLQRVEGTGLEGRITRKDLMRIIDSGTIPQVNEVTQPIAENISKPTNQKETVNFEHSSGDIEIPLTSIRRAIANNMVISKQTIPHAWMMLEVDVTNLVNYRNSIKDKFKETEGYNITYFAFFIKAIARALKEFPMMNSVWAEDKIIQKKDINISIAVATEDALFVPVIKNADEMSVKGIAKKIHELSNLTRTGKLRPEHIQGGTFTVNNTGSFGSVQSMGVINHPQAAIVQVESIIKRPVILNDNMIAPRDMVNLCASIDHRILDGLICGKFLNRVKDILENVNNDFMSVY